MIVLVVSLAQADPQFSNILKPAYNFLNTLSGNDYQQGNQQQSPSYQTQYVQYQPESNYQSNYQPTSNYQTSSSACGSYWSYRSDSNGQFGLVTIPDPSYVKNVIRISLSLAARLPSVCTFAGSLEFPIGKVINMLSQQFVNISLYENKSTRKES